MGFKPLVLGFKVAPFHKGTSNSTKTPQKFRKNPPFSSQFLLIEITPGIFAPPKSPPNPNLVVWERGTLLFLFFFVPNFCLDPPKKPQQEERPIRQILYLGELLETCHFQSFWVSEFPPKMGREGGRGPQKPGETKRGSPE